MKLHISKEFKIGLITTVAIALLYWGFNFLKGESIFSKERIFYAEYKDVSGLVRANPVIRNGLNVGQVRNMYFRSDMEPSVIIELVITNDIFIPENSTAKIISQDLLGSKAVLLNLGDAPDAAQTGDTLHSEIEISIKEEVSKQFQPLKNKAEDLMMQVDTVLSMLQGIFSRSNAKNFSKSVEHIANSFANLESTTSTFDTILKVQRSRLDHIFENIESITYNLRSNEAEFNNIIANFSAISDSLAAAEFAQTVKNVENTMENLSAISEKINNGEGSMGQLVNNDTLYIELEKASRDLNMLIEDIRKNPKKYVKFSVF